MIAAEKLKRRQEKVISDVEKAIFSKKIEQFFTPYLIYDDKYLWIKLQAGNAFMKIIYRQNNVHFYFSRRFLQDCCAVACEDKL